MEKSRIVDIGRRAIGMLQQSNGMTQRRDQWQTSVGVETPV